MTPLDYYSVLGLAGQWDEVYERSAHPTDTNLKFRWYEYSRLGLK